MISSKLRALRLGILACSALLATGVSHAGTNTSFGQNTELLFYFQSNPSSGDITTLYASTGTLLTNLYNTSTAGTSSYTTLGNLNSALTAAYGSGWASLTSLYMGAAGARGANDVSILYSGSVDPYRTVYYTAATNPANVTAGFTTFNSNIVQLTTQFENASPTTSLDIDKTSSFIDDQNPFVGTAELGYNLSDAFGGYIPGASMASLSAAFSYGLAGNVILALDLYRMKPSNTVSGEDSYADLTPQLMGTVVLKSTGEVGFVAVPEPSTIALCGAALSAVAFCFRRRKTA